MLTLACALLFVPQEPAVDAWATARQHAAQSRRAVAFNLRYADGWLRHADPRSGLLPRTLRGDAFWNAKDCAADNFPFLWLTGRITGQVHLMRAGDHLLAQERRLCSRLDGLPDDFLFATQSFRSAEPRLPDLLFGAAEYCKDGLLPMTEWAGQGPWSRRMTELLAAIARHCTVGSPAGPLPTDNLEVHGDLLQACSRAFWMTGDPTCRELALRLGDHHIRHRPLLQQPRLHLRDHGCEVIGGLAEAWTIVRAERDHSRADWAPALRALCERILAALHPDGLLPNAIDPRTGAPVDQAASDGTGYVLDAVLTVDELLAGATEYAPAIAAALRRQTAVRCAETPGLQGADGCADTLEGALNLLQRLPDAAVAAWIDREIETLFLAQRPDGILEAWYGDGNSARTMWLWALWKTQGIAAQPWREDLALGAERLADGALRVVLAADFAWQGALCFDRPRHREHLHLPADHPRINQWPEWFAVDRHDAFRLQVDDGDERLVTGADLWRLPLRVAAGQTVRLRLVPAPEQRTPLRGMAYRQGTPEQTAAWQNELRARLAGLLGVDVTAARAAGPARPAAAARQRDGYRDQELDLPTPGGAVRVRLTVPTVGDGPFPAVVCIHGHGGDRHSVHDATTVYRGFAAALAAAGFVTIACDVGQHAVRAPGATLLGERLADLLRCVDHLAAMAEVDPARIGCAGLSLGGEMAMWLGALDLRIAATVSSGFLTTMDQLEQGHCLCWKLPGLRQLADFADLYALIAPRALQCQNGLGEPHTDFTVPLAKRAMAELAPAFSDLGAAAGPELHVHRDGHVMDVPATAAFLRRALAAGR